MDNLTPLPPEDADGNLARKLGAGEDLAGTDAFERALIDYRSHAQDVLPVAGLSQRLWARVARQLSFEVNPVARAIPLWARWSAAAAAMVLVALGLWSLYTSSPAVVAVAENVGTVTVLDDGSQVTLRAHTTLFRLAENSYELSGEAFFDVVHDPGRQFAVSTELGEVRVLGTRFDVRTWGNETAVFLESGRVLFRHSGTGAVDTLASGQELIAGEHSVSLATPEDQGAGPLDWMSGNLVFGKRPLHLILAEVEHHYNIAVLVPDSLKTETLSGRISLSSAPQSLNDLATVLRGRFTESPSGVFTFVAE